LVAAFFITSPTISPTFDSQALLAEYPNWRNAGNGPVWRLFRDYSPHKKTPPKRGINIISIVNNS